MTTSSNITIGIDEVGRGPWAGPLLVSAVALDMNQCYEGLADGIGLGWVDVAELDRLGMTDGLKLGAKRAYSQLPSDVTSRAKRIVIDGNIKMLDDLRAVVMVKADAQVQAVSAASIVAKVARDSYMTQLDRLFPEYGFAKHAGYGTRQHVEALTKLGVISGIHRSSFAPIKNLGYQIVARNWRTKLCEIDIIAHKDKDLCFVEVKYRHNDSCGDGLDAITPRKLQQMRFAAEVYMHSCGKSIKDCNPRLMVVALSGRPPVIDELIDVV